MQKTSMFYKVSVVIYIYTKSDLLQKSDGYIAI